MNSKECLEQIKSDLISTQCEIHKDNCYDERILAVYQLDCIQNIEKDLDRLEELEKKETPMKVKDIHVDEFYCPNCQEEITYHIDNFWKPKYCVECGQKLDWSEEDE